MPELSSKTMPATPSTKFLAACAASFLLMLAATLAVNAAPTEKVMGVVQKIFYFHVPCAWLLMLSAIVCAGGSLAFLFRGSERGDRIALSAAELGVLFGLWEARLTSSLLLWLMMVAYVLARRYGGTGARRLAAALALFAAVDIPLVYFSVRFFRSIHPQTTVVSTLGPGMRGAFWLSLLTFTVLWLVLMSLRLAAESAQAKIVDLEALLDQAEEKKP
jgi:heme exporter protein C